MEGNEEEIFHLSHIRYLLFGASDTLLLLKLPPITTESWLKASHWSLLSYLPQIFRSPNKSSWAIISPLEISPVVSWTSCMVIAKAVEVIIILLCCMSSSTIVLVLLNLKIFSSLLPRSLNCKTPQAIKHPLMMFSLQIRAFSNYSSNQYLLKLTTIQV